MSAAAMSFQQKSSKIQAYLVSAYATGLSFIARPSFSLPNKIKQKKQAVAEGVIPYDPVDTQHPKRALQGPKSSAPRAFYHAH